MPDATDKPTFTGENIEIPASFYLGREYDLAKKKTLDKAVMYDARDLTTHGVVVGMTESGKTGLCINLLEEAAIDGIPCIIVDLKGDKGGDRNQLHAPDVAAVRMARKRAFVGGPA